MSLRWRLMLSYIVIILVTLALTFVTLILVARPLQSRVIRARLTAQSRLVGRQLNNALPQDISPERIAQQFSTRFANSDTRLLFVDATGSVLADSQNEWVGQTLTLSGSAGSGSFRSPDGEVYMFSGAPMGTDDAPLGYVAAVAARPALLPGLFAELSSGFLLAGFVALLVSLLLGLLIARSIALPLQRIARATTAVASGDYEHRVPENGPPEIRRVATNFNLMTGQVQANQQAMRDFVSNVSHELKTPLTSIQGFSQAIMEGATQDEAAQQRAAGIIHQEAGRMSRLVEDLLDLARIDSGQIVMQKTPLELAQILTTTVNRLLPLAAQKKVTLRKQWPKLPPIVGDGDRLAQVFTNLLSNAVKYTPEGGQVKISGQVVQGVIRPRHARPGLVQPDATTTLSERGDFVEIAIADSGPGIPPDDLARIFERFYQVDKSRKRGRGTGLGLAITKEIIETHGGVIRVESVEGVGAKFIVMLPITEADARTLVSKRR